MRTDYSVSPGPHFQHVFRADQSGRRSAGLEMASIKKRGRQRLQSSKK